MARGRSLPKLELSESEREQLRAWARSSKTSQSLALRSRIVLSCRDAPSNHEVAQSFHVTPQTVGKWRARFIERRLEGLFDEPRPGAPRKLAGIEIERLVADPLAGMPTAADGRWSSRALAAQLGVSQSTVSRVLRATALRAHPADSLRVSIAKMCDIVGLHVEGPLRAVALCVEDEQPPVASPEPPGWWPASSPPLPACCTLAYPQHGATTLFEALDQATAADASRGAGVRPFLAFLRMLDAAVPTERALHIVVDDREHRSRPSVDKWFARKPRFRLHTASSSAAWLAQVERWFALLGERQLRTADERSAASLERALRRYLNRSPRASGPFLWVKAGDDSTGQPAKGLDR